MASQSAAPVRALRLVVAGVLALVGVIGLVLPLIPGIPLLIVAALVAGSPLPIERRRAAPGPASGLTASERWRLAALRQAARVFDRRR
jgi:hypothetical protein